jgi:hypothetical protein
MVTVEVQTMSLLQAVFDIPMRIAGDWTWAIQRTDKTGCKSRYPLIVSKHLDPSTCSIGCGWLTTDMI